MRDKEGALAEEPIGVTASSTSRSRPTSQSRFRESSARARARAIWRGRCVVAGRPPRLDRTTNSAMQKRRGGGGAARSLARSLRDALRAALRCVARCCIASQRESRASPPLPPLLPRAALSLVVLLVDDSRLRRYNCGLRSETRGNPRERRFLRFVRISGYGRAGAPMRTCVCVCVLHSVSNVPWESIPLRTARERERERDEERHKSGLHRLRRHPRSPRPPSPPG